MQDKKKSSNKIFLKLEWLSGESGEHQWFFFIHHKIFLCRIAFLLKHELVTFT